jgi:two-component system, OmpR family, KDP operon response regulator KdpE
MSCILVVDDDRSLLSTLAASLKAQGFETLVAHTGELGVYVATHEHPDLAIVDLGLPRIDGIEVIKQIRAVSSIPIIVLSARDQEAGKVAALNEGADDYVTKPFGNDELVARIRAALRRSIRSDAQDVVETATFTIDIPNKRIQRDGNDVHLSSTEWRLLLALVSNEGKVMGSEELLRLAWGPEYESSSEYVRIYVSALRKKLEMDARNPKHILTEATSGYRFVR